MHLFVSDLDGTLLRSDARLSAFARASLVELLRDGLQFTVASARALASMQVLLRGVPLALPVIELNGAVVSDFATGEPVCVHAFERDLAEAVLAVFDAGGCHPFVAAATAGGDEPSTVVYHAALENSAMQWYRAEKRGVAVPRLRPLASVADAPTDRVVSYTVLDREPTIAALADALAAKVGTAVAVHRFANPYCPGYWELSVQDVRATKANAIATVQSHYGFAPDALTVFGDNLNDLDMFHIATRAVAVQNAAPEILAAATHVADTNNNDGVPRWLQKHR